MDNRLEGPTQLRPPRRRRFRSDEKETRATSRNQEFIQELDDDKKRQWEEHKAKAEEESTKASKAAYKNFSRLAGQPGLDFVAVNGQTLFHHRCWRRHDNTKNASHARHHHQGGRGPSNRHGTPAGTT